MVSFDSKFLFMPPSPIPSILRPESSLQAPNGKGQGGFVWNGGRGEGGGVFFLPRPTDFYTFQAALRGFSMV